MPAAPWPGGLHSLIAARLSALQHYALVPIPEIVRQIDAEVRGVLTNPAQPDAAAKSP